MSARWIIGDAARLSVSITDAAGAAADPSALRLKIKPPSGAVTTYTYGGAEIVRDGVGLYRSDLLLSAAGWWMYRWETDAPSAGVAEGALEVTQSIVI